MEVGHAKGEVPSLASTLVLVGTLSPRPSAPLGSAHPRLRDPKEGPARCGPPVAPREPGNGTDTPDHTWEPPPRIPRCHGLALLTDDPSPRPRASRRRPTRGGVAPGARRGAPAGSGAWDASSRLAGPAAPGVARRGGGPARRRDGPRLICSLRVLNWTALGRKTGPKGDSSTEAPSPPLLRDLKARFLLLTPRRKFRP